MADGIGFKVGISLGAILGAFAVGALHDVPAVETETRIIRVPEVHTKKVPGPTKYVVAPYPRSCDRAGQKIEEAWQMNKRVIRLSEQIKNRTINELVPNSAMGADLSADSQFVLDRSNLLIQQMYLWEETGGMVRFYLDKCADEIESGKKGVLDSDASRFP